MQRLQVRTRTERLEEFLRRTDPSNASVARFSTISSTAEIDRRRAGLRAELDGVDHTLAKLVDDIGGQEGAAAILASWRSHRARIAAKLDEAKAELRLARERDRIAECRPPGCTCLGLGGTGAFIEVYGLRYFDRWCSCPEGRAHQAAYLAKQREVDAADAEYGAHEREAARLEGIAQRTLRSGVTEHPHLLAWSFDSFPRSDSAKLSAFQTTVAWSVAWRRYYDDRDAWTQRLFRGEHDAEGADDGLIKPSLPGLFLWGQAGRGKTGLAASALHRWLETQGGRFVHVPALLDRLRSTYVAGASEHAGSVIWPLTTAMFLVLDDLGAERPTAWTRAILFQLVTERHARRLPTVFTSNYPIPVLAARMAGDDDPVEAERIASRLVELCQVVEVRGADLRTVGGHHGS